MTTAKTFHFFTPPSHWTFVTSFHFNSWTIAQSLFGGAWRISPYWKNLSGGSCIVTLTDFKLYNMIVRQLRRSNVRFLFSASALKTLLNSGWYGWVSPPIRRFQIRDTITTSYTDVYKEKWRGNYEKLRKIWKMGKNFEPSFMIVYL